MSSHPEIEVLGDALRSGWIREASALSDNDDLLEQIRTLRDACNQSRLAFAGYVSVQSAIEKLDALPPAPTTGDDHE